MQTISQLPLGNELGKDGEAGSYQDFVKGQTCRNPSLSALRRFLASKNPEQETCRIAIVGFMDGDNPPTHEEIKPEELRRQLQLLDAKPRTCQHHMIIIEDLTRQIIEDLGSTLNIDPFFFASHLYAVSGLTSARAPPNSLLPSRKKAQNFSNILYHRILQISTPSISARKLLRRMNIPRRAVFLPKIRDLQLAVVQHAFSVLKCIKADGTWLCVMLVDPPISAKCEFLAPEANGNSTIVLHGELFQGGYEDFQRPNLENASIGNHIDRSLGRHGMFEDLIYYMTRERLSYFDFEQPTIVQLSYYALRIIAAEWVNYETLVNVVAKEFEYTIPNAPDAYQEMERLNINLNALQSWLRRRRATQIKIQSVIDLIKNEKRDAEPWHSLLEDYKHLYLSVEHYGKRLEGMLPMVASFVQMIDTRRSFVETANISRLTYLAVIFIPLSFVTGVFSMNPDIAPGGAHFWIYFVIALPLTIFVYLIARPPNRLVHSLLGRSKKYCETSSSSV